MSSVYVYIYILLCKKDVAAYQQTDIIDEDTGFPIFFFFMKRVIF